MECVSPPELDDQRLWSYVDGEAEPETMLHLERCEYCGEKAKALAQLQGRVQSRLYRINCPSSLELGEYRLRMLPDSKKLVVAQHVRECTHCARELAQLEGYLSELAPTGETGLLEGLKVLVARWVGGNPNGMSPAPSALRGEAKGPITFETDGIVIILDIQPTSKGLASVLGQVAADDQDGWTGAVVELRQADAPPLTAALDDLGAFRFEEVHPGSTEITITSLNGIIVQTPIFDIAV
jgi:hypothetical protein